MNATKYSSLTKTSKATATRDLQDLLLKGAIIHLGESGGRSTKCQLHLPKTKMDLLFSPIFVSKMPKLNEFSYRRG